MANDLPHKRSDMKLVYQTGPGKQLTLLAQPRVDGAIAIVASVDSPPRLIMMDGSTAPLVPNHAHF